MFAIQPGSKGKEHKIVWTKKARTGWASPLTKDGLIYLLGRSGVLTCVDAETGKKIYGKRVTGTFAASPVLADGNLYMISEDGSATVVKAGRTFKALPSSFLSDKFLATPTIANGSIYLRSDDHLYCISKKK